MNRKTVYCELSSREPLLKEIGYYRYQPDCVSQTIYSVYYAVCSLNTVQHIVLSKKRVKMKLDRTTKSVRSSISTLIRIDRLSTMLLIWSFSLVCKLCNRLTWSENAFLANSCESHESDRKGLKIPICNVCNNRIKLVSCARLRKASLDGLPERRRLQRLKKRVIYTMSDLTITCVSHFLANFFYWNQFGKVCKRLFKRMLCSSQCVLVVQWPTHGIIFGITFGMELFNEKRQREKIIS